MGRLRFCAALALMVCLACGGLPRTAQADVTEEAVLRRAAERGEIIRLHILAEDNTPEAQARKLRVRDAVLAAFGEALEALPENSDVVYAWLMEHAEDLRRVAESAARAEGFAGTVAAETGWLTLPAKRYGAVMLPAGEYRGLRVTLGAGEGRNWWCILFPRLCLAAASDEPWQAAAGDGEPRPAPEALRCDSLRVLSQWLLWP